MKGLNLITLYRNLNVDEKANVITHGFGLLLTLLLSPFLLFNETKPIQFWGLCVFIFGMIFMFLSSTLYHLSNSDTRKIKWRLVDHISIFFLIGGTYTPFVLYYFNTKEGYAFLLLHWIIIAFGIMFKFIFKTRFEIVSLALYLILGWMVVFVFDEMSRNMPLKVEYWLIAGGLSYTIGVFFYVKTKIPWSHTIWHIFVLMGCAGHFVALFLS
ncbi:MAG: hemolysin III family protein [Saprospiraceae bacterium]